MKNILILANSSGGLYDFRNQLVKKLLSEYKLFVSVPDDVKTEILKEEGCHIITTPINRRGVNPLEDIKLYKAYKKLLKQLHPDLVLCYTIKPNIYGGYACRKMKIPYIATITGLGTTFQKEGFLKKVIIKMYQMGLKKAECIFFQNDQNRDIFEKCNIKGKDTKLVQGSGVDLQAHPYVIYPNHESFCFLYIGRIMKEKGIEEFLQAAKALHSENTTFQILGACDEDYQQQLDEYEKEQLIVPLGFQKEVHKYIKAASAVVLPTYHEGMSNVLMEASATGRPVIASAISGCKEIFEDGITGFGFEPKSSEELIGALKKFMSLSVTERAEMGKKARQKMELEFDRSHVTDVYMEEVSNVLYNN